MGTIARNSSRRPSFIARTRRDNAAFRSNVTDGDASVPSATVFIANASKGEKDGFEDENRTHARRVRLRALCAVRHGLNSRFDASINQTSSHLRKFVDV